MTCPSPRDPPQHLVSTLLSSRNPAIRPQLPAACCHHLPVPTGPSPPPYPHPPPLFSSCFPMPAGAVWVILSVMLGAAALVVAYELVRQLALSSGAALRLPLVSRPCSQAESPSGDRFPFQSLPLPSPAPALPLPPVGSLPALTLPALTSTLTLSMQTYGEAGKVLPCRSKEDDTVEEEEVKARQLDSNRGSASAGFVPEAHGSTTIPRSRASLYRRRRRRRRSRTGVSRAGGCRRVRRRPPGA